MHLSLPLIQVELERSPSSPRYTFLRNSQSGDRLPSFDLLADSLPTAVHKVADFVADIAFTQEYEVLSIAVHGPAIATRLRRGDNTILSYDHVPAFWIKTWPEVAQEWIDRPRRFGWPPASVIDEIRRRGVLLVAACQAHSTDPHNEWRLSFSVGERVLIDSLSSVQRLVYLYAKMVWMSSLKSKSFLASYHLKTALLWLCEERPTQFWRGDNLVVCVGDIFRWLRQEIAGGNLRHYFISTDNMIPKWVESTGALIQSLDDIIDNMFQVRQRTQ